MGFLGDILGGFKSAGQKILSGIGQDLGSIATSGLGTIAALEINKRVQAAAARGSQAGSFPPSGDRGGGGQGFDLAGFGFAGSSGGGDVLSRLRDLAVTPGSPFDQALNVFSPPTGGGMALQTRDFGLGAGSISPVFRPVRRSMDGAVIGARAHSLLMAQSPTGAITFFRHVGKPILFSGDARICRSVRKSARRALSASGGR